MVSSLASVLTVYLSNEVDAAVEHAPEKLPRLPPPAKRSVHLLTAWSLQCLSYELLVRNTSSSDRANAVSANGCPVATVRWGQVAGMVPRWRAVSHIPTMSALVMTAIMGTSRARKTLLKGMWTTWRA